MILKMKQKLYTLIKSLGYNITDNGNYEEQFPQLMIRTSNHKRFDAFDTRMDELTFTLDIFSTYSGEKEILEISENIADNLYQLKNENPEIMAITQRSLIIIGDNSKGPVQKHGIITYSIVCSSSYQILGQGEIENV